MELTLARQSGSQVLVTCDNQPSHTFDLLTLLSQENGLPQPLDDPVAYGQSVFAALFPPETLARRVLASTPERVLLITQDNDLDAVPWEYAYGPEGFLVLECHFVRGLPADQRIAPPKLDNGLHIVAVPSTPLSHELDPLNIDGEWIRLKDIIQQVPCALTLERTRPATIEQVRTLVANQSQRVIHFMGHGGQQEAGAVLCFGQDNGDLDLVTAKQFMLRVRGTVFLVTLNACVSATPGATSFSNLAAALVRQKIPYALGMRFSIPDEDARAFSRVFYSDLARGTSVEEALLQARLTLANSPRSWSVGVPVLYTALTKPSAGFASKVGTPMIKEHQPYIEVNMLPRAEGAFQGRIDELKELGTALTGDSRPPLITIHGAGGQGKTALAREAVERFTFAWPGGVWATSLENLLSRELFVSDLARFLGIDTQKMPDPNKLERLVIDHLVHRRTLIVLDNAETLVEAVEANNEEAIRLAQFLREQLPRPPVSLLTTSRSFLGWTGESGVELPGLSPGEGVRLFWQHAPQRGKEIDRASVWKLSEQVEGHPLSLRLLADSFNVSSMAYSTFVQEYEARLLDAENKYVGADHRHRTLYACIETTVRYLNDDLRTLLSGLWVFQAPFLPQTAATIFDSKAYAKGEYSPIYKQLYELWQCGLITYEENSELEVTGENPELRVTVVLHRLLPSVRSFVEHYLEQVYDREALLARFGSVYADLAYLIFKGVGLGPTMAYIASNVREDMRRGVYYVEGITQGRYLFYWGWVLQRLGDRRRGLELIEQALEIAQGRDRELERDTLNAMAVICRAVGEPQRALMLYEQALLISREISDQEGEAAIPNNMALVYQDIGQPQHSLMLYERVLPILREMGDRRGEASTLNNMALVYKDTGQPHLALSLYEQALPIWHEIGDRVGEALTLNNIAIVYQDTGQPQRALEFYEQALLISRKMKNRPGEALALHNIAYVFQIIGQPWKALELSEQALLILREVGDRKGEAMRLNNMGRIHAHMGQPQKALALYEEALSISREIGDRSDVATAINNIATVYTNAGQLQSALKLCEQVLPIMREVGNRADEATVLNNMGMIHQDMGQPQKALALYEEALSIKRELGDRAGEAMTLVNISRIYLKSGKPQRALALCEEALPIKREVGDRAGEAVTLVALSEVYRSMGQLQTALTFYEQALPIMQEVGDRDGEASVLSIMAMIYQDARQYQRALTFYEQALSIWLEVDDRASEAKTRNNIAAIYQYTGQLQQSLTFYEQALSIQRDLNDRAGEVTILSNMAVVSYQLLENAQAIMHLEKAISIMIESGLSEDAAGRKVEYLQELIESIKSGVPLSLTDANFPLLSTTQVQQIVANTVAVMTTAPNQHAKWRVEIARMLQQAQNINQTQDAELFTAILTILDGRTATLSEDHPYAQLISAIQNRIASNKPQSAGVSDEVIQAVRDFINAKDWKTTREFVEMHKSLLFLLEVELLFEQNIADARAAEERDTVELLELYLALLRRCKEIGIAEAFVQFEQALSFDAELISRSIAALLSDPQEKMAHAQYLIARAAQTEDERLKELINTIQLALFGGNLTQLGQSLSGVYRQAWETIVAVVESGGVDPHLFEMIIRNTLAVLGPAADKEDKWRNALTQMRDQAMEGEVHELVALLDAIIGLLDARGNPTGLGRNLAGIYAQTWQTIVERLA